MLQLRDTRYNDVRLIFHEEEHKYNDSLGNKYVSTTTILHEFQPKFDKPYWLRKKSKELGISRYTFYNKVKQKESGSNENDCT